MDERKGAAMNCQRVFGVVLGLLLLGMPVAQAKSQSVEGFLYGTVETENDHTYKGLLRWGNEEGFWDDLFNSTKEDLPYLKDHGRDERSRIKVLGVTVGYRYDYSSSRMFIVRFGDIDELRPGRGDRVDVVMKNGEVYEVDGGSNDIGGKVTVFDDSLGEVTLNWEKIEKVTFEAAPAGITPPAYRLHGKLETEDGTFEGFIQWDSQECMSTDRLDGDTDDADLSIEMGKIESIEKRSSRSSSVKLKDGRQIVLRGSNDVDSSIRGIFVEDERFGRVKVSWDAFESLEFTDVRKSGRGYADYKPATHLRGKVTDYDEKTYSGPMVFDLDETESWELLNGSLDGVEYFIPFDMIQSIRPGRHDTSELTLRNGIELELEDGQDVAERNAGIVIMRGDSEREVYIPWRDVEQIVFD